MTVLGTCIFDKHPHFQKGACENWQPVEQRPAERPAERDQTALAIIKASRLLEVENLRACAARAEREQELVRLIQKQALEYADLLEKSL